MRKEIQPVELLRRILWFKYFGSYGMEVFNFWWVPTFTNHVEQSSSNWNHSQPTLARLLDSHGKSTAIYRLNSQNFKIFDFQSENGHFSKIIIFFFQKSFMNGDFYEFSFKCGISENSRKYIYGEFSKIFRVTEKFQNSTLLWIRDLSPEMANWDWKSNIKNSRNSL